MKSVLVAYLTLLFSIASANTDAWYVRWDGAGTTWYEKWNNVINAIDSIPKEERMELLGKATAFGADTRMSDEKREIFIRAQSMMLAIPGHAEYYRDRINNARELMEKELAAGHPSYYATARHALSDEVMYGFETLSQLPSVENVRVLGEFLFDERGYVKVPLDDPSEKQRYESVKHSPVYRISAKSLAALPIVGKLKPPVMDHGGPEDVAPWRQWYQEIKDGKRTFRFEGDPTEYDLNGPAPKEKLERIALKQRMESDRAARHGKNSGAVNSAIPVEGTPVSRKPATVALIAAALSLLASVMWYFRRVKTAG